MESFCNDLCSPHPSRVALRVYFEFGLVWMVWMVLTPLEFPRVKIQGEILQSHDHLMKSSCSGLQVVLV